MEQTDQRRRVSRRRFLAGTVAAVLGGAPGCLGGITDAGKRPFETNPVADGIDRRPQVGPGHGETPVDLVAFDDPSCPACASFYEGAFERIQSAWIQSGRATLSSRAYYFVHEWGRPAASALLEAYRRDPAAYRALKAGYYRNQDAVSSETLLDTTRNLVADADASVDPDPIVRAARERTHRSVIDADDAAGTAAGVAGVPTVFVFHEGEFVTTLGDDDFEAYQSAVESHA